MYLRTFKRRRMKLSHKAQMSMFSEPKDVIRKYDLPENVRFCARCTMSNQRPRITFDDAGICSACVFSELKSRSIDWEKRERELIELCVKHRSEDGSFDVIVPCSGGKDGSFVAHQLKHVYGMNPLCVTWAPLRDTTIGRENLKRFIGAGFDHIMATPNPEVVRALTRLSLGLLGDPFQPFIYGQVNFPLTISVMHKVPLIMYGENGEVEYGGDMKNALRPTRDLTDQSRHYFSSIDPEHWANFGLSIRDLRRFSGPALKSLQQNQTEVHFFSYYKYWDPQENYYYCSKHTGFQANPERSEGTYSKYASLDDMFDGFHYYLGFIKFGIGRTTSDSAHEVRDGKISRDEAVALVHRFDGEFPRLYLAEFLNFVEVSEVELNAVIDSWRSPHLWRKTDEEWILKHQVQGSVPT